MKVRASILTLVFIFNACGDSSVVPDAASSDMAIDVAVADAGVDLPLPDGAAADSPAPDSHLADSQLADSGGDASTLLSCSALISCRAACQSESCEQGCLNNATAQAQALFGAFQACIGVALQGTCMSICDPSNPSQACLTCVENACQAELTACGNDV